MRLTLIVVAITACDAGAPPAKHQPPPPPPKPAPPKPPVDQSVRAPIREDLDRYLEAIPGRGKLVATLVTTQGTIHCDLDPDQAPMTVANFVGLATGQKPWLNATTGGVEIGKHFYDGLTFHRVIPQFMIQGGDPQGRGIGGPGYSFVDEPTQGAFGPGTLAMANAGPNTNGSQFFIMEGTRADLSGHYTLFGHCGDPDVVTKIANVPRDSSDKPDTAVTIESVTFSRTPLVLRPRPR